MLWAVICEDNPNTDAIRDEHLAPHREYLKNKKDVIVVAGATQTDDGSQSTGSLFLVAVDSRAEAEAFSNGDPFTQNGVFKSVTIKRMRKGQWNPATGDGA
jgi:uncharacterized protein YciI